MTWALATQLAGAFLGGGGLGVLWMWLRHDRQIRQLANECRRLTKAVADLTDDLFTRALHDDPDDGPVFLFDEDFPCHLDAVLAHPPAGYYPDLN